MKTINFLNKILLFAAAVGCTVGCTENKDDNTPKSYAINVTAQTGGSAAATVDGKAADKAEAAATVTLTATADEGYVFSKWEVVSGGAELADADNSTTTFKMPAKDVSVKAVFVEAPAAKFAVTVTNDGNGTASAKIGDAEVTEAEEGQVITLSATAKTGYEFAQWTVSAGEVKLSDAAKAETTFTMPAADVAVKAEFIKKEAPKYTIEVIAGEHGTAVALAHGEEVTEAVEYMSINLIATPDEGYVFSKWTAEGVELFAPTEADIRFSMPANAVKITAEFVVKTYGFTLEPAENGSVTANVDGSPAGESLEEGKTVLLTATANEGFIFSQWVTEGVTLESPTAAETSFTMPAADVSVKAEFLDKSAIKRAVTVTNDGNGTATATIGGAVASEAAEGETVAISATANNGYVFSKWVVESGDASIADVKAASTTFTMPANEVSIKAEFVPTYAITLTNDGNGSAAATVGGAAVSTAAEGQEVSITATANAGYAFSKWVVESGGAVLADASAASTTFTMPAAAVSIKAEFYAPDPSITFNKDADLWANTASFTLDYIPAGATVSVSYKRTGDTDWQTAAVEGNKATIAPVWEDKTEADWFTHYAAGDVSPYSRIKKGTGVFAANTYDYKLTVNGSDFTGQFTTAAGDAIPNGDMSGWNGNSPNASGASFWSSGNNTFTSSLCSREDNIFGKATPAAKLKSTQAVGVMAAGNMFTGSFDFKLFTQTGTVKFGQKYDYTARPSALKVKYHAKVGTVDKARSDAPLKSGDQDRARIYVVIMDWNNPHEVASSPNSTTGGWDPEKCKGETAEGKVIGYGSFWIPASTEGDAMVDAEIPMQWFDKTAKPASGNYSIIISCACNAFGDYFTGCTSNVLYVDDFEWAY